MTWTILGVNEWSATDASDGLPVSGTRAWPSGADTVGDVGIMALVARDTTTPPTGTDDWTLVDSFTGGDTDSNGLRNVWVYRHVRGASNPAIHDTWVTSYAGFIATYRHSSETAFTFGTPAASTTDPGSTSHTLTGGVTVAGSDSLVVVVHGNGRSLPTDLSSTAPSTGVTGSAEDTTTAPSTSAWYGRGGRGTGASPGGSISLFDAVLNSGSTGDINLTSLSTKARTIAFTVLPGAGGGTPIAFTGTVPTLNGTEGIAFSESLASYFSGTETPFSYAVQSGTLPAGLTLNSSTGAISGTPTTAGTSSGIVVRGADATPDTADTNSFSIVIAAASSPPGSPGTPTFDSISKIGYRAQWSAASGDVDGYEYRINAGSWVDVGTAEEATITGRTPGTTDTFDVRAYGPGGAGIASTGDITLPLWGFAFSAGAGLVFGAISGSLTGLARETTGAEWTVYVHNDSTRALLLTSSTLTIDSSGRLPDLTDASLDPGTYFVSFRRAADGAFAAARLATEDLS